LKSDQKRGTPKHIKRKESQEPRGKKKNKTTGGGGGVGGEPVLGKQIVLRRIETTVERKANTNGRQLCRTLIAICVGTPCQLQSDQDIVLPCVWNFNSKRVERKGKPVIPWVSERSSNGVIVTPQRGKSGRREGVLPR